MLVKLSLFYLLIVHLLSIGKILQDMVLLVSYLVSECNLICKLGTEMQSKHHSLKLRKYSVCMYTPRVFNLKPNLLT